MVDVWRDLGISVSALFWPLFRLGSDIWERLSKAASELAEGFMGSTKSVKESTSPAIVALLPDVLDEATLAMGEGSPDPKVKEAVDKMVKQLLELIEKESKTEAKSLPTTTDLVTRQGALASGMVILYAATHAVSMALDASHPFKDWGFKSAIMDVLYQFKMSDVIGPMIQAPIWSSVITPLRMRMSQRYPYRVPDARWIPSLRAKGILEEEVYTETMSYHALDGSWAKALAEGEQVIPGFGELREMLWRKAVDEPVLREALTRTGIRSDFLDAYIELTKPRVGPGDLITMSIREAFEERPGDEEIVDRFVTEMAKWGYDREACLWHWRSHWRLPALGEVFDMHHRDIEMPYTVETFLKWADYSPEWRGPLEKLSWDLPGRIDARWLYRWNLYSVEDLRDLLIKRGLDPEYADDTATATARNQWLTEIRKLIDNSKRDFGKGYIVESTLRANLTDLDLHPDWIEYHVVDAVADAERARKDDAVDALGDAWLKDIITDKELEDRLATYIIRPEALETEIQRLYIRKYKKLKEKPA